MLNRIVAIAVTAIVSVVVAFSLSKLIRGIVDNIRFEFFFDQSEDIKMIRGEEPFPLGA